MAFPIMFIWFLIAIFIFQHHLRKSSKANDAASKSFWDKEQSSLVVRKKDLEATDYLHPTLDPETLVDESYFKQLACPELFRHQEYLRTLIPLKMVNFQTMTNADLRLAYGTAMMPTIEVYEENYHNYIRTLLTLAEGLLDVEDNTLATLYLEEGIHMGSDIKHHYLLLASIYDKNQNYSALTDLIDKAKDLTTLTKDALVKELESLYSDHLPSLTEKNQPTH